MIKSNKYSKKKEYIMMKIILKTKSISLEEEYHLANILGIPVLPYGRNTGKIVYHHEFEWFTDGP